MNVRKRTGQMAQPEPKAIRGAVTQAGRFASGNQAKPIRGAVALDPKPTGPTKVKGAVSGPK